MIARFSATPKEFPALALYCLTLPPSVYCHGTFIAHMIFEVMKIMKIMLGYDGSKTADSALDDLTLAGLPYDTEALVMSVAEVWLPPEIVERSEEDLETVQAAPRLVKTNGLKFTERADQTERYLAQINLKHRQKGEKAVAEAEALATHAGERLRKTFPGWSVRTEATYGSPAWEIITRAGEINADLIVVGSHGRSAVGRFFLGSISQKILTEAPSSVRIARGRVEVDPSPTRIMIGYDGSPGAKEAVAQVARRHWRKQSEVRLIAVTDPITPSAIGRFVPPIANWIEEANEDERVWMEKIASPALKKLRDAGLKADLQICDGNPKDIIIEEAARWHADTIFVGANRFGSRVERFLLGSVSAAVAARAACSVEVVRKQ